MPLREQQQIGAANDAPEWAISEKAIHEVLFCKAFLERHPMKCINGRFYDIDGLVQDDTIKSEIAGMLTENVRSAGALSMARSCSLSPHPATRRIAAHIVASVRKFLILG